MENKRTARMMKVERIHLTYCDVVVACLMNSIEVAINPGQRALQYWRPLFRQMIGDIGELVFGLGSENPAQRLLIVAQRSEEHTSELQSLMRISYAFFCLKQHTTI